MCFFFHLSSYYDTHKLTLIVQQFVFLFKLCRDNCIINLMKYNTLKLPDRLSNPLLPRSIDSTAHPKSGFTRKHRQNIHRSAIYQLAPPTLVTVVNNPTLSTIINMAKSVASSVS